MSARFLLDTNILSEPAKPRPSPGVLQHLAEHEGELATAAPVWHELVFGVARLPASARQHQLEEYLAALRASSLAILPYDQAAAQWQAEERARLVARGKTPSFVDSQIAAIAATNELVLVTRNTANFADFGELEVQNWFD